MLCSVATGNLWVLSWEFIILLSSIIPTKIHSQWCAQPSPRIQPYHATLAIQFITNFGWRTTPNVDLVNFRGHFLDQLLVDRIVQRCDTLFLIHRYSCWDGSRSSWGSYCIYFFWPRSDMVVVRRESFFCSLPISPGQIPSWQDLCGGSRKQHFCGIN